MCPNSESLPFSALHEEVLHNPTPLRAAITAAYRRDEQEAVQWLLSQFVTNKNAQISAEVLARKLVTAVRRQRSRASGVDALMHEFSLSSEEGIALMCLAEALLRIPDHKTADRLIADKLSKGDWQRHLGESPSLFVNAATWGLVITGKLITPSNDHGLGSALSTLIKKGGEPLIRKGVDVAMRMLGNQFVTGQTISKALQNSHDREMRGYRYSYDMLGEAALTDDDAQNYFAAYKNAIHAIGNASNGRGIQQGPGISVKLSALHPRYVRSQRQRVMQELLPRLKTLLLLAQQYNIGLNIDAEESDRLELSLDLLEALAFEPALSGFDGIGFVVQAYQKRCPFVIDFLADLARRSAHRFMVRLVKGAYWDTEIKRAQVDGVSGYPVYTRKVYTDVSYLVCAQKLLQCSDVLYPQFATHNAHTLASVYSMAQSQRVDDYEFQCLHGMGESLYDLVVGPDHLNKACRIYAPVGPHASLLAYLVRRLLENGANSSFVNQIVDENISLDALIADPVDATRILLGQPHPAIPLPRHLFGDTRENSAGFDLSNEDSLRALDASLAHFSQYQWHAQAMLSGRTTSSQQQRILNPANHHDVVGTAVEANKFDVENALASAYGFAMDWQIIPPSERAAILCRAANLLEFNRFEFIALAVREAGKTIPNAIGEVREAVDFLRYYATQVKQSVSSIALGPVVCISPWNFPLAIFIGQISAALATGNVVLAKPAEQTPLIAFRAVQLLYEAGIPRGALQYLPGRGDTVGAALISDTRIRGVLFTGSTEVAQRIHRILAQRCVDESCDIPFIAETGGINAMFVDSSALPEQVVQDVMHSAFDSAGQRCSALRVLCLQADIAEKILSMLFGAMQELRIGKPDLLSIDVGPVIDDDAKRNLLAHIDKSRVHARQFFQLSLDPSSVHGTYVAPTVIGVQSLSEINEEVFGPVLYVLRFQCDTLPQLIEAINVVGFGLTLGVHSRIDKTIHFITSHAHVGNIYVNRNMVGAVVGVQPFGGEGKSGTGPKAGGPFYLSRLQRFPSFPFLAKGTIPADKLLLLTELTTWAQTHHYDRIVDLCDTYISSSLCNASMTLPGPTGERNTLLLAPRGPILCAASDLLCLVNQFAAIFATGNTVLLLRSCYDLLPSDFPISILNVIIAIDSKDLLVTNMCSALVDPSYATKLHPLIAAREGAIIQLIHANETSEIPLWRLQVERSVCMNTTAAGGNTHLMSMT